MKNITESLVVLMSCIFIANANPTDNMYFGMLNLTFHNREAIYDLGNGHEQKLDKERLFSTGFSFGKRYDLPSFLRLAMPLMFDYGVVKEDTFSDMQLEDGTTPQVELESVFLQIGFSPEVQFVLPATSDLSMYFTVGGGIHYVSKKEREWAGSVKVIDYYLEKYNGVRWSVCAGGGLDLTITKRFAVGAQYLLRYWNPVKGKTDKGLFPLQKVDYKERFLSQGIGISLMIKR